MNGDPLIGARVVIVTEDEYYGWVGVLTDYDEGLGMYVITSSHKGQEVTLGATLNQFRPLPEEGDGFSGELPEGTEETTALETPTFGMTQRDAAQFAAAFVSGVATTASTFKAIGGYLEFEAQDFPDLLMNFQSAVMDLTAILTAMSIRTSRLYAAYKLLENE